MSAVWAAVSPFAKELLAFLGALTIAVGSFVFQARVKIIFGRANNSYHRVKVENDFVGVYCEKFYIQNVGRKPAKDVDIAFSKAPGEISVFPASNYKIEKNPEGHLIVTLPHISPKELVIVDTIELGGPIAEIRSVKSPEAVGRRVNFEVVRDFGWRVKYLVAALMFGGLIFFVNIAIWFATKLFSVGA